MAVKRRTKAVRVHPALSRKGGVHRRTTMRPTRSLTKTHRELSRQIPVTSQEPARIDPRLVEGVARYNHHQFFECHEVLEQLWLQTTGATRDFYKGLIQAAVAFHHWSRDNRAGALTLARSASRYLKRYQPTCCGIDVEGFVAQFSELFQWLRRHRLRYDPHLVPAIRWARPPITT